MAKLSETTLSPDDVLTIKCVDFPLGELTIDYDTAMEALLDQALRQVRERRRATYSADAPKVFGEINQSSFAQAQEIPGVFGRGSGY